MIFLMFAWLSYHSYSPIWGKRDRFQVIFFSCPFFILELSFFPIFPFLPCCQSCIDIVYALTRRRRRRRRRRKDGERKKEHGKKEKEIFLVIQTMPRDEPRSDTSLTLLFMSLILPPTHSQSKLKAHTSKHIELSYTKRQGNGTWTFDQRIYTQDSGNVCILMLHWF